MAISFVAAGTSYIRTSSGTSFTWNKPAGVVDGDLLIGFVALRSNNSLTLNQPSGWTWLQAAFTTDDDTGIEIGVAYKFASSEPSSWNGSVSSSVTYMTGQCVAFRGVQSVLTSGQSSAGATTSFNTATVNNTQSGSWRTVFGAYTSGSDNYNISSNETTRRVIDAAGSSPAVQAAIWDSNGSIGTGNTSRSVSRSATWSCAAAVIVILRASTGTPASGTWASTLAKVSASSAGEVHNNATLATTLSPVSAAGDGYGQPPVVSGTLGASLAPVTASVAASSAVSGTLDTIVPIGVGIDAETRVFGIRVINVEAEDRTIVVESRAVAD